jgi:hypothetical protein
VDGEGAGVARQEDAHRDLVERLDGEAISSLTTCAPFGEGEGGLSR